MTRYSIGLVLAVCLSAWPNRSASAAGIECPVIVDIVDGKVSVQPPLAALVPGSVCGVLTAPPGIDAAKYLTFNGAQAVIRNCPGSVASPSRCFAFQFAPPKDAPTVPLKVILQVQDGPADEASVDVRVAAQPPPASPEKVQPPPAAKANDCTGPEQCAFFRAIDASSLSADQRTNYKQGSPQNIYEKTSNVAIIGYDGKGNALWGTPPLVDENDEIVVVIVPLDGESIPRPVLSSCQTPEPIRIAGSVHGLPLRTYASAQPSQAWVFKAKNCASESGLHIIGQKAGGDPSPYDIKISTLALYRLTVGLGFLLDWSNETTFTTGHAKGGAASFIVEDKHMRGIDPPVALIALRLAAVDMKRERDWRTVVSPVVGISFSSPLEHAFVGLMLEPIAGIGVVGGVHFHQEPRLTSGYSAGDTVPADFAVPTVKRWATEGRDWFLGFNVDASAIARLVGAITP